MKATTARYTAEQLKLKAERDLQRIEVEARQKVTSTKAEAESLALNGFLRNPSSPRLLFQLLPPRIRCFKHCGNFRNLAL